MLRSNAKNIRMNELSQQRKQRETEEQNARIHDEVMLKRQMDKDQ